MAIDIDVPSVVDGTGTGPARGEELSMDIRVGAGRPRVGQTASRSRLVKIKRFV